MKKITLLFLVLFQWATATEKDSLASNSHFLRYTYFVDEAFECDACGCSANGGSMGFSSMLNENFVGIRYLYQSYTTKEGVFVNSPWTDEHFNTVQVWSRIPLTKRIQLTVLVPYHSNSRAIASGTQTISGLGDLTVMAMYTAFQTKSDSTSIYHQKWQMGGGVKAPTGTYNVAPTGTLNPSFQLGTGSWDYLVLTEYTVKRKLLGLNNTLSYTYKTENKKRYQFGNQFNYATTLFYLMDYSALKMVPQLGFAGEVYASNKQVQQEVLDTKGNVLFGKIGVELGKNKFSVGINTMIPIHQDLTGGNVKANHRISVHVNYTL
jgi:hypothetical protein